MKKNISRNPLWPDWYNGKKIDEVQFGRAFLEQWPLKCVNGTLYTLDGPVEDESEIKQRILENIEEYVTSGLSKKVTNILETIKLLAFSDPFPIEQDCIHLQNGVYHLPDGTFQESRLFCQNRLPVKYDPKAPTPERWLTFLHELLDDADIPTLQEYLGYCLIPSTKGQKMMLIVGKGGEGKSRIGLVLKRLMGDAASNGSVQKVENNRFARADLERRLLMIDDDMDMNALPKTNYIKTIVTAEAKLDLERKGVQSYQRDIYARFLCFGNGALTSLYDHSDGFFRRQLILTTKDKPADRTDDPFLVEKMCAELEGRCIVVQRCRCLCMSKPPGDRCDRYMCRNQDACIRMAEAMKVHVRKIVCFQKLREPGRDDIRVHRLTIPFREQHIVVHHFAIFQCDLAHPR